MTKNEAIKRREFQMASDLSSLSIQQYLNKWLDLKKTISPDHIKTKGDEASVRGAGLFNLIERSCTDDEVQIFISLWEHFHRKQEQETSYSVKCKTCFQNIIEGTLDECTDARIDHERKHPTHRVEMEELL